MSSYLITRLLIVVLVKFFIGWAFNAKSQLIQFFITSYIQENLLLILGWILSGLVIALGIICLNVILTVIRYADKLSIEEIFNYIKKTGLVLLVKEFFQGFPHTFSNNFNHEINRERYPNLIFFFLLLYFPFMNGNPLINNYYGVYKEFSVEELGRYDVSTSYLENKYFIIPKTEKEEIQSTMNDLEATSDDGNWDFIVKKRGYIFLQAGLLDGYRDDYSGYRGFSDYIECIIFSLIEKMINAMMYFLIPFVLLISIYHYKISKPKINTIG